MNRPDENDNLDGLGGAELFKLGTEALSDHSYEAAHRYLQAALAKRRSPGHLSQYALALAHHSGDIQQSLALCHEAIKHEPRNSEHFLRLGVIYLIAGRRKEALRSFTLGLRVGRNPAITSWLALLGQRQQPMLPFLSRNNLLNKYLGKLRSNLSKKK